MLDADMHSSLTESWAPDTTAWGVPKPHAVPEEDVGSRTGKQPTAP